MHSSVPAQPSGFEAEAELDTRIKLKWLWPVQEPITLYELHYWEAGSDNKVQKRCQILHRINSFRFLFSGSMQGVITACESDPWLTIKNGPNLGFCFTARGQTSAGCFQGLSFVDCLDMKRKRTL